MPDEGFRDCLLGSYVFLDIGLQRSLVAVVRDQPSRFVATLGRVTSEVLENVLMFQIRENGYLTTGETGIVRGRWKSFHEAYWVANTHTVLDEVNTAVETT